MAYDADVSLDRLTDPSLASAGDTRGCDLSSTFKNERTLIAETDDEDSLELAEVGNPTVAGPSWTFLSSHAQVFLAIAQNSSVTMREIGEHLEYTERMVQNLVRDLEAAGYLSHTRVGRRNLYQVCKTQPMRHPLVRHNEVSALLGLLGQANRPDLT